MYSSVSVLDILRKRIERRLYVKPRLDVLEIGFVTATWRLKRWYS